MENMKEHISESPALIDQPETSSEPGQDEIYTLSTKRLSNNQRKIERRKFKNSVSDRRAKPRLSANGEPQPDRRLANRIANTDLNSGQKTTK